MRAISGFFEKFSRKLPLAQLRVVGFIREKAKSPRGFATINTEEAAMALGLEPDGVAKAILWLKAFRVVEQGKKSPERFRVIAAALDRLPEPRQRSRWPEDIPQETLAFVEEVNVSIRVPSNIRKALGLEGRTLLIPKAGLSQIEALCDFYDANMEAASARVTERLERRLMALQKLRDLMRRHSANRPDLTAEAALMLEAKARKAR